MANQPSVPKSQTPTLPNSITIAPVSPLPLTPTAYGPDTLWPYYKHIKASGFLDLLPILASTPSPTVEERRRLAGEYARAQLPFIAALTMPEQAHHWLKVVQLLQHYEVGAWGDNTTGGTTPPGIKLGRREWKEVRTHILLAAWNLATGKGTCRVQNSGRKLKK